MPQRTILIIDPDASSLNFLMRMLQEGHYAALGAGSGKEGLISVWRDHPDLIIFDPAIQDISAEEFLQKIRRDSRSANTPVLALSSDKSREKRKDCLQAGCNQYIFKSSEAVAELPGIIFSLLGERFENQKEGGILIVFLSARGGTGTSSLCANLAASIAVQKPEASLVVVDLVQPIGSIATIVGYEGDVDLVSLAEIPPARTTENYFKKHLPNMRQWRFQLLAGAPDPDLSDGLKAERIPQIIDVLQKTYDYVVVDLGRSLSRVSLPILKKADVLVLTMGSDKSTVALTRKVWDYLRTKNIDAQNMYAILNNAIGWEELTKAEAEMLIGLPIKSVMPYTGNKFSSASNLNLPVFSKYPADAVSTVLSDTARDMLGLAIELRRL